MLVGNVVETDHFREILWLMTPGMIL